MATKIVSAGLADRCKGDVSYVIGVAEWTSASIITSGIDKISNQKIIGPVGEAIDICPDVILTCCTFFAQCIAISRCIVTLVAIHLG